ncbi:MAG: DUF362 domain-containing protein [Acidobacteria bacterium]|nr:DUF362 domain-containing protein [Acidobacteriota bacterium]
MTQEKNKLNRREFINVSGAAGVGLASMFSMPLIADEKKEEQRIKTNFDEVKDIKRTKHSLPGPFPGKVTEIVNDKVWKNENDVDIDVIRQMVNAGMEELTGKKGPDAWKLFVEPDDIIGIKPNPVGPKIISTTLELVKVVIEELEKAGMKKQNIIIWDRVDVMLSDAGFTKENFPGVGIESMQTIDMSGGTAWKDKNGKHVSEGNFDKDVYYWADVEGPNDDAYLNQNVFNTKYSYFGKLITKKLTKIINLPVLKNTGNGVSMATKNLGYAAIINTNRLHRPLFFDVCTEVLGFPCVRDKLVLNILDGLRGQYEGGPMPNAKYVYKANKLLFATDPFAQDYIGYQEMLKMRKADTSIKVNESPRYTDYLRYAEKLGLGIGDPKKITHKVIKLA